MNKVELVGNFTKDVTVTYSAGENPTALFRNTIATQRRFKNKQTNEYESDFISVKAYGSTAEFIGKYFTKGSKIGVSGRIETGSYTNKEGQKVYTTDVVIEEAEFVQSKGENSANSGVPTPQNASVDDFINQGLGDDSLPFK